MPKVRGMTKKAGVAREIARDRELLETVRKAIESRTKDGFNSAKSLRELAQAAETVATATVALADLERRHAAD
jgi:hypothetical protein